MGGITNETVHLSFAADWSKEVNPLLDLIRNGKTASEIMLAMDIGHKQILKHHVLKLIATDKEFYEVPGLYDKNRRKAFVNSRGEIRLRMPNIDFKGMPLKPETEFDVIVEGSRVILIHLGLETKPVSPEAFAESDL